MQYDLIVVGLGAMGSATLYQAAKSGASVLGIDRYNPPHEFGSSHAETRITRLAVGEGAHYVPLVLRSHQIWQELEAQTGQELLYQPGGYFITPLDSSQTADIHYYDFVARTAKIAQQANIPFEIRSPADVHAHQPTILVDESFQIGFEPSGGIVMCERAIALQIQLAQALGATVRPNEPVHNISFDASTVTVSTSQGQYTAAKVVIATGAWIPDFMPPKQANLLTITRQVVYWFTVEDPTLFSVTHFPFIIWEGAGITGSAGIFPIPPDGYPGIKLLTEQLITTTNPRIVSRTVSQTEIDTFYHNNVANKVAGITPHCIHAAVCLYTSTPDFHFIIDYHPDSERVILASPCSGHGFKHSAALGEAMAQLALTERCQQDLSHFTFKRFEAV